jgi:hypothetical protein
MITADYQAFPHYYVASEGCRSQFHRVYFFSLRKPTESISDKEKGMRRWALAAIIRRTRRTAAGISRPTAITGLLETKRNIWAPRDILARFTRKHADLFEE